MIKSVYIKDFAIIKELEISFKPGLTVISGETGSGKSILLSAIATSAGHKANKVMVRTNCQKAIVETGTDTFFIRRVISKNGQSRCFKNTTPISVSDLKTLSLSKIDFHSQNDQQLILKKDNQIDFLDRFCKVEEKVLRISELYQEIQKLNLELIEIEKLIESAPEKIQLLNFQLNEIELVNLKIGEDIILGKRFKKISNSKEIILKLKEIEDQILNSELCVIDKLGDISNQIVSLEKYDEVFSKISKDFNIAIIQIQEVVSDIINEKDKIDFDHLELKDIEERFSNIESLKRKYGGSIDSVFLNKDRIKNELEQLQNIYQTRTLIKKNLDKKQLEYSKMAIELHRKRRFKSDQLSKLVQQNLSELNMHGTKFKIKINLTESEKGFVNYENKILASTSKGIDEVEFYLSANRGEKIKPLSLIASGGETSRIMLALKKIFQINDPVDTLILDEIDSGISGETAEKVAEQLVQISKMKQVICITHLSQIMKRADQHLYVKKSVKENETEVYFNYLTKTDRKKVIKTTFE